MNSIDTNFPSNQSLSYSSNGRIAHSRVDPNHSLKQGIWIYFFLLIFEGALRKWFLPALATPLLIIRDPIALWLLIMAWQRGKLTFNFNVAAIIFIGVVGTYTAVLVGHGSLLVAVYGARILLFHFPLMYVIGRIFTREDILKMGKTMLWLSAPMAVLITLQFYSPQSAWVNRGVGGDIAGAGFDGALGFFRPPATFSFTNGTHLFFGLAGLFVFYFWLESQTINRWLLIMATVGLVISIPFSISRSLLQYVTVSFIFSFIAITQKPKHLSRLVFMTLGGVVAIAALSQTSFFNTAFEAFSTRFTTASEVEGGLEGSFGDRVLGGLKEPIVKSVEQPFFGYGLGLGTNAGGALLSGGNRVFLIAEGEWGRLIGELGPIMGLTVIFIRLSLSIGLIITSYRKLVIGDLLPWMLVSYGFFIIPSAQWAQPTALGFSTLIGGLILASLSKHNE